MTISFNSGVDPEEVKFNGQDMETVVLYNDQFPNGATVWEKVVGVEYTITSGFVVSDGIRTWGWRTQVNPTLGSISPAPPDIFGIVTSTGGIGLPGLIYSNTGPYPNQLEFNNIIYNLAPFNFSLGFGISFNILNPFFASLQNAGNIITFKLIYP